MTPPFSGFPSLKLTLGGFFQLFSAFLRRRIHGSLMLLEVWRSSVFRSKIGRLMPSYQLIWDGRRANLDVLLFMFAPENPSLMPSS